ncbi:succinate dehydrogenase cytochrome b subunit [Nibricoccus sp. IMCC34717]|uniref:succinate dehydrogenase cytochrome b subunit n=1 Tax=Nibricoccus sp. IMCC34717 TaxID=3034021 RepID=UPI00384FCAB2
MNPIVSLFRSSIGRKFLMAVTGLILIGFVTGHLVGNLQIFTHPDHINGYAHFLQNLGPALWAFRIGLLACIAIHVWAAVALSLENRAARGAESYGVSKWLQATLASRYMKQTGLVVLAFFVYHIAHFTVGAAQSATFKANLTHYTITENVREFGIPLANRGDVVHDVYSMVYLGFANPVVSLFYIVAVTLLTLHILHGIQSSLQTIGWRNERWIGCLRRASTVFCLLYVLGSIAIPGLILTGIAKPAEGTTAAKKLVASADPCCTAATSLTLHNR